MDAIAYIAGTVFLIFASAMCQSSKVMSFCTMDALRAEHGSRFDCVIRMRCTMLFIPLGPCDSKIVINRSGFG